MFDKVDYNNNGMIEPLEVEVAILSMYNIVNKRLPGWQDPPTRDAIQASCWSCYLWASAQQQISEHRV